MKATFILLLLGICSFSMAQRTITGQVKDADDETLPGVSIIIKGTSIGTTSDIDGNYSLTVSDEATDLIFNYIDQWTICDQCSDEQCDRIARGGSQCTGIHQQA